MDVHVYAEGADVDELRPGRRRASEPLRDPAMFGRVSLDEFGAPSWPNGADLAPEAL